VPGRMRFRTVCTQIRSPKQLNRDSSLLLFRLVANGGTNHSSRGLVCSAG